MGAKHPAKLKFNLQAAIEVGKIMERDCMSQPVLYLFMIWIFPLRNFWYETILSVLHCWNMVSNWNRAEWTGPCTFNKTKVKQILVKSLECLSGKGRGIHVFRRHDFLPLFLYLIMLFYFSSPPTPKSTIIIKFELLVISRDKTVKTNQPRAHVIPNVIYMHVIIILAPFKIITLVFKNNLVHHYNFFKFLGCWNLKI